MISPSSPDIAGIGSAIHMDMSAILRNKSSAPSIGHIAVYDIYFRNDEQCRAKTAGEKDTIFVSLQLIICAVIVKRIILHCLAAGEIICTILDVHFVVLAVVQTSGLDIIAGVFHLPNKLKIFDLDGIEPAGNKFIEIAGLILTEHILLVCLE